MIGWFAKLLLVFTACAPILLTYAFRLAREGTRWIVVVGLVGTALLLVAICHWVLALARSRVPPLEPFDAEACKPADTELMAFVVAYLLPLVGAPKDPVDLWLLGFVLVLLAIIVSATHAYHFNPLLALFGYHFYEVAAKNGMTFVLLSRRTLRTPGAISAVRQLTDYVLLDDSKEVAAE